MVPASKDFGPFDCAEHANECSCPSVLIAMDQAILWAACDMNKVQNTFDLYDFTSLSP